MTEFEELLCPEHNSNNIRDRNLKFGVWMHLGMMEYSIPFTCH